MINFRLVKIALGTACSVIAACIAILPIIDPPEDHGVLSVGERASIRNMGFGYIESVDGGSVAVRLESGELVNANAFDVADVYDRPKDLYDGH